MQTIDSLKAKGELSIVLTRADGRVDTTEVKNLVVDTGLNYILSRMKDTTLGAMSHMAIGAGNASAVLGNTALGNELGRVALTSTTVSANTVQYIATFGAGVGTGAVTEAGVFNAGNAGTLLCRTVFGVVTKDIGDSMIITWTITVS